MKTIAIIYQKQTTQYDNVWLDLLQNEYNVRLFPLDETSDLSTIYNDLKQHMPNLILTINLAGFSLRTTGQDCAYTQFPINTFHYIEGDLPSICKNLYGMTTFTMKFLVTSQDDLDYLHTNFPDLYDVEKIQSLQSDLPSLLRDLDWRLA